jgi:hypothetical protein
MGAATINGGTGGNRTRDHQLKRLLLYRLSYRPIFLKRTYSIDNKAQRQGVFYSFGVYKLCIKKAKAGIENQR